MQTIRERVIEILDKQIKKGMKTYGHTLDDCPDDLFDMDGMALEEVIDALQYSIKKNSQLKKALRQETKRRIEIENYAMMLKKE